MKKIISFLALLLLTVAGVAQTGQRFTIEVSAAAASVDSNLFIKNQIATVESKMSNYRSSRLDSLFIRGAAQYLWNRAANYTARSFTDKGYVDSIASLYLLLTDTSAAFAAYLRKGDFKILSALDLDSSNISDDDLAYYDSASGKLKFKAFPSIYDYTFSDSGLRVINTGSVTIHNGILLWKGAADGLYTSLTGSYANPSWISSLAWAKLTGVPSTFAPSAHTHALSDLTQSGATSGQVPQWNGSAWVPATVSGGGGGSGNNFDNELAYRMGNWQYYNEWMAVPTATSSGGNDLVVNATGTGTGAGMVATPSANRPGIVTLQTGSTATGRTSFYTNSGLNTIELGGGAATLASDLFVPNLSTSGERFAFLFGFYDATTMNQTDGIYFLYDEGGVSTGSAASANWQCVTVSNSNRTFTTTSTAVSSTDFRRLSIEVNAAGTSVDFKIGGTTVATHTTNIPTGNARLVSYGYQLIKSIGTGARTVRTDWIYAKINFTTSR